MRILNFIIPISFAVGLTFGMVIYILFPKLLIALGVSEAVSSFTGGWAASILVILAAYLYVLNYVDLQPKLSKKAKVAHLTLAIG